MGSPIYARVRQKLIRTHSILCEFGVNPLRLFRSVSGLLSYCVEIWQFKQSYKGRMELVPCLYDRYEEGGVTKSEYFWQDLLVARWVFRNNPIRHVDVGSRIDGFVAHVASFREIEVFDVRPISAVVPGVIFRQANLMVSEELQAFMRENDGYCDSLSCLHVLEHFGLGRYGDPLDSKGYARGFVELSKLVKSGGHFYLAVPIGRERVEFNANWVFHPRTILDLADSNCLELVSLTVFTQGKGIEEVIVTPRLIEELSLRRYTLGIFVFKKYSIHRTT